MSDSKGHYPDESRRRSSDGTEWSCVAGLKLSSLKLLHKLIVLSLFLLCFMQKCSDSGLSGGQWANSWSSTYRNTTRMTYVMCNWNLVYTQSNMLDLSMDTAYSSSSSQTFTLATAIFMNGYSNFQYRWTTLLYGHCSWWLFLCDFRIQGLSTQHFRRIFKDLSTITIHTLSLGTPVHSLYTAAAIFTLPQNAYLNRQ